MEYDIGYVAFLDVLGWSHAIEKSVDDAELRKRMASVQHSVLERVLKILDPNDAEQPSFNANTFGYQFSDAHILAVPQRDSTRAGAEFVAMWCRLLAREYFRAGLLVRGGVTIGKIHCEKDICFGPALTRAYKLEQSAVFPMIIIDPQENVRKYFLDEEQYGAFSDKGPHTYNFFAKTSDERVFVDFLRSDACTDSQFRPIDVFMESELSSLLKKQEIASTDPLEVRVKKSWLLEYARGVWRNASCRDISQIDFEPREEMSRRRLSPENYLQDFG